jgi:hypothetical protein
MDWTVQESNPSRGKIFHTCPDWAWHLPPTPSNVEVKERVELHLCFLSGPLWPVSRVNFTFTFSSMQVCQCCLLFNHCATAAPSVCLHGMDRDNFALASVQIVFKKVEQLHRNAGEMPGFHTSPYFCIYIVVEC